MQLSLCLSLFSSFSLSSILHSSSSPLLSPHSSSLPSPTSFLPLSFFLLSSLYYMDLRNAQELSNMKVRPSVHDPPHALQSVGNAFPPFPPFPPHPPTPPHTLPSLLFPPFFPLLLNGLFIPFPYPLNGPLIPSQTRLIWALSSVMWP